VYSYQVCRYYEAVVELPLRKAHALDPAEDAYNDAVEESRRKVALSAREQCYEVVTNALKALRGKPSQAGTPSKQGLNLRSSLDDASRERYIRQIVQLGVRWPDRAFHKALYQTMIDSGMENELLELAGPDLVPFLQGAGNYQTAQVVCFSSWVVSGHGCIYRIYWLLYQV
jgi:nuclear pore complex protein Nup155